MDAAYPDVPIYSEEIKQGLDPPCFFVKLFPVAQERQQGRRYIRQHTFDIHYFPRGFDTGGAGAANEEMHWLSDTLYDVMEYIDCNGLIRGTGMRHEIVDGVLHFFVSYELHLLRQRPASPPMERMDMKQELKYERGG
ncbi:phage tail terminator family protein [Paenibacillus sp. SYP-B4298]|uniref:phage tail terminator family protein n=1 Tax=Paenibacillus sp. SYP-B4298 TaxID=2996034 RepID=UPI0022DE60A5|nr:hypothetical protein [Paenibacillus sp. SYP-B4298]